MTHDIGFQVVCRIDAVDEDEELTEEKIQAHGLSARKALVAALEQVAENGFSHPLEDSLFLHFEVSKMFMTELGPVQA